MAEYVSAEDYQRMQAKLKDIDKKVARIYRKRLREAAPPLGRHVLEYGIEKMVRELGTAGNKLVRKVGKLADAANKESGTKKKLARKVDLGWWKIGDFLLRRTRVEPRPTVDAWKAIAEGAVADLKRADDTPAFEVKREWIDPTAWPEVRDLDMRLEAATALRPVTVVGPVPLARMF